MHNNNIYYKLYQNILYLYYDLKRIIALYSH